MDLSLNLFFAIFLLLFANLLRIHRWNNWLKAVNHTPNMSTVSAYSLGQIANLFLPFKSGDLLRILLTKRSGFEIVSIFCLLFIERLFDALMILSMFTIFRIPVELYFYVIVLTGVIAILTARFLIPALKLRSFTDDLTIKYLFWTLRRSCERTLLLKQALTTLCIWFFSLAADLIILGKKFSNDLDMREGRNEYLSQLYGLFFRPHFNFYESQILVLVLIPIFSFLIFSSLPIIFRSSGHGYLSSGGGEIAELARIEFDHFLVDLKKFRAIVNPLENLVGSFRTGSKAHVVLLRKKEGQLVVRKFAENDVSVKLKDQFNMLFSLKSDSTPNVFLVKDSKNFFCYEMDFIYEGVTLERSLAEDNARLVNVLTRVKNAYFDTFYSDQMRNRVNFTFYLDIKCNRLLLEIHDNESSEIHAKATSKLRSLISELKDNFEKIKIDTKQILGHGDLSSTNILLTPDSVFFIDPLPNQEWLSLTSDFAKLYFSLSSRIELIDIENSKSMEQNWVRHENFDQSLSFEFLNFCQDRMSLDPKEVILQAVLHLLRVIPYKLSNDQSRNLFWLNFTNSYIQNELRKFNQLDSA